MNGKEWSISLTTLGPITDIPALLSSQEWYGSSSAAIDFATALGAQEGAHNGNLGPYFLWGARGVSGRTGLNPIYVVSLRASETDGSLVVDTQTVESSEAHVFAIASAVAPVPLPATGALLLAGIGGLAALRRGRAKAA